VFVGELWAILRSLRCWCVTPNERKYQSDWPKTPTTQQGITQKPRSSISIKTHEEKIREKK
jgi:hypothetical protein